jgi:hypothetical protein
MEMILQTVRLLQKNKRFLKERKIVVFIESHQKNVSNEYLRWTIENASLFPANGQILLRTGLFVSFSEDDMSISFQNLSTFLALSNDTQVVTVKYFQTLVQIPYNVPSSKTKLYYKLTNGKWGARPPVKKNYFRSTNLKYCYLFAPSLLFS